MSGRGLLAKVAVTEPCVLFATLGEVTSIGSAAERIKNSDMMISGTMALGEAISANACSTPVVNSAWYLAGLGISQER